MAAIVYDTGALLAAKRRNPDFLALHDEATAARIRPLVPAVVLAQAWRGGPQHQISRVLKGCDIIPDDERTGRAAGVACPAAGTTDVAGAATRLRAARPACRCAEDRQPTAGPGPCDAGFRARARPPHGLCGPRWRARGCPACPRRAKAIVLSGPLRGGDQGNSRGAASTSPAAAGPAGSMAGAPSPSETPAAGSACTRSAPTSTATVASGNLVYSRAVIPAESAAATSWASAVPASQ